MPEPVLRASLDQVHGVTDLQRATLTCKASTPSPFATPVFHRHEMASLDPKRHVLVDLLPDREADGLAACLSRRRGDRPQSWRELRQWKPPRHTQYCPYRGSVLIWQTTSSLVGCSVEKARKDNVHQSHIVLCRGGCGAVAGGLRAATSTPLPVTAPLRLTARPAMPPHPRPLQSRVQQTSQPELVQAERVMPDQNVQRDCAYQGSLIQDHATDESPSALARVARWPGRVRVTPACKSISATPGRQEPCLELTPALVMSDKAGKTNRPAPVAAERGGAA